MYMYGLRSRDQIYTSESDIDIHKASGCRVGGGSVKEVVNVVNVRSGVCNGGWSMIEITLVSRCIIGA